MARPHPTGRTEILPTPAFRESDTVRTQMGHVIPAHLLIINTLSPRLHLSRLILGNTTSRGLLLVSHIIRYVRSTTPTNLLPANLMRSLTQMFNQVRWGRTLKQVRPLRYRGETVTMHPLRVASSRTTRNILKANYAWTKVGISSRRQAQYTDWCHQILCQVLTTTRCRVIVSAESPVMATHQRAPLRTAEHLH